MPYTWNTSISIPIQRAARERFLLTYRLLAVAVSAEAYGQAAGDSKGAFLTFEGLPQGSRVVSCQGFTQDFPVATRSLTWGALKTAYR